MLLSGMAENERMHHRVGVPAEHRMSAAALAEWAAAVAAAHQPNSEMPEATVHLPEGIWFDLESAEPTDPPRPE